jgi:hypothetical protein
MTEYQKTEWLHSQLSELIEGNKLPIDELKIMQSFIEDIREKHFNKNRKLNRKGAIKMNYEKEFLPINFTERTNKLNINWLK